MFVLRVSYQIEIPYVMEEVIKIKGNWWEVCCNEETFSRNLTFDWFFLAIKVRKIDTMLILNISSKINIIRAKNNVTRVCYFIEINLLITKSSKITRVRCERTNNNQIRINKNPAREDSWEAKEIEKRKCVPQKDSYYAIILDPNRSGRTIS